MLWILFTWRHIRESSYDGAERWFEAFHAAANRAVNFPEPHSLAPENDQLDRTVRQFLFSTRHGNVYPGLFVVVDNELRVLRVRGQGQPELTTEELPLHA